MNQKNTNRWEVLSKYIKRWNLKKGAEVGCNFGKNIEGVLKNCPDFQWIAVDSWAPAGQGGMSVPERIQTWAKIYAKYHKNITFLGTTSIRAAATIDPETLDLVFIDGHHGFDSVVLDIHAWLSKVRRGGWIGGHDYWKHSRYPGVRNAVHKFFPKDVIIESDRVWMYQNNR